MNKERVKNYLNVPKELKGLANYFYKHYLKNYKNEPYFDDLCQDFAIELWEHPHPGYKVMRIRDYVLYYERWKRPDICADSFVYTPDYAERLDSKACIKMILENPPSDKLDFMTRMLLFKSDWKSDSYIRAYIKKYLDTSHSTLFSETLWRKGKNYTEKLKRSCKQLLKYWYEIYGITADKNIYDEKEIIKFKKQWSETKLKSYWQSECDKIRKNGVKSPIRNRDNGRISGFTHSRWF